MIAECRRERRGCFMENINEDFKQKIWEYVEKEMEDITGKFPDEFKYDKNGKDIFNKYFDRYFNDIKNNVMRPEVVSLDSHKITAVIICSVIKADALKISAYQFDTGTKIFDGNEKIAVKVGLSYMATVLKKLLEGTQEKEKFIKYEMPEALMCETDYLTIICRNLYYEKTYYELNPIGLANTLFLFEQYTLLKRGIDLGVLRKAIEEKCC